MRYFALLLVIAVLATLASGHRGGRCPRGPKKLCVNEAGEREFGICNCDDGTVANFTKTPCPEGSYPDVRNTCVCPDGQKPKRNRMNGRRHPGPPKCSDGTAPTDCKCTDEPPTDVDWDNTPCPGTSGIDKETCKCPEGFQFGRRGNGKYRGRGGRGRGGGGRG